MLKLKNLEIFSAGVQFRAGCRDYAGAPDLTVVRFLFELFRRFGQNRRIGLRREQLGGRFRRTDVVWQSGKLFPKHFRDSEFS